MCWLVTESGTLFRSAVRSHLEQGAAGRHPDTPTVEDVVFQRTVNAIIGSNETALEGIRTEAVHEGIRRVRLLPGFSDR